MGCTEVKRRSFIVDENGRQDALSEEDCQCKECKQLLTEFFAILDIEEESMNERKFHPNHFSSCRVVDGEKMGKIMNRLKLLSQQ